jgi:hypothetical protein
MSEVCVARCRSALHVINVKNNIICGFALLMALLLIRAIFLRRKLILELQESQKCERC